MKTFQITAVLAFAAAALAQNHTEIVTVVTTDYTTFCPSPTEISMNDQTYTVTEATLLTITNCPCTITKSGWFKPTPTPQPGCTGKNCGHNGGNGGNGGSGGNGGNGQHGGNGDNSGNNGNGGNGNHGGSSSQPPQVQPGCQGPECAEGEESAQPTGNMPVIAGANINGLSVGVLAVAGLAMLL